MPFASAVAPPQTVTGRVVHATIFSLICDPTWPDNHDRMVMLIVLCIVSMPAGFGLPHGGLHMLLSEYHALSVYKSTDTFDTESQSL